MSNKLKGCFSHQTDDWRTPSEFMNKLLDHGWHDTFPYQSSIDEFSNSYQREKLFINPPFSKLSLIPKFVESCIYYNNDVLLLLPARTDTKYFHELLALKPVIYFVKGRLHFNDSKKVAPFPTLLMYFSNKYCYHNHFLSGSLMEFPL